MFNSALIQVEEASSEIRHYLDRVEINPERQSEVEERLSGIFEIARKHRIHPNELLQFQQNLEQELAGLNRSDAELEQMAEEAEAARLAFLNKAEKLSKNAVRPPAS